MSGTITITEKYVRKYDQQSEGRTVLVQGASSGEVISAAEKSNWNTAYAERRQWDGGATNLDAATGRTSLDVYSKAEGDARYVEVAGDTMTGALLINSRLYVQDDVSIGTATATTGYKLDVNGRTLLRDRLVISERIQHTNFSLTSDFSGVHWQATSDGDFNIRRLVVREFARFRELIIDQLSVIAGSTLLSAARGKVKSINGTEITLEDPNSTLTSQFVINDFFWIKSVDVDGGIFSDIKGQIYHISENKIYLDFNVAGATGTWQEIQRGDVIVQRGHPTIAARQRLIYTTVSDNDGPVTKYFTGINSLAAFDNITNVRLVSGNLENAPEIDGHSPSGMGFFSDNAYLTGRLVLPNAGMTDAGSSATSIRSYAGDTYANRATAPYRVQQDGKFYSTAGGIAGWEHDATAISKIGGTDDKEKVILSSADRHLAFQYKDNGTFKDRLKLMADGINTLANVITANNPETVIGRDGMYSYLASNTFMYIKTHASDWTIRMRGKVFFQSETEASRIQMYADQLLLEGYTTVMGEVAFQSKINIQSDANASGLPTSDSGLSSGDLYREGGVIRYKA